MKSKDLTPQTPTDKLPLSVPATYWLDLRVYEPAKEATKMNRPILILHGQRDYQVTLNDFKGWKEALNGKHNVQYHLYPDLNHLFIAGTGKCTPAEYEKAGYVSQVVINDLVHWISSAQTLESE